MTDVFRMGSEKYFLQDKSFCSYPVFVKWIQEYIEDFLSPELDTTKRIKKLAGNADRNRYMTDEPAYYDIRDGKLYFIGIVNPDTILSADRSTARRQLDGKCQPR